jgi:hypothetical protein
MSLRSRMVSYVRKGYSLRKAARYFGVSLCTIQRWVGRAGGQRLSRVDLSDKRSGCPTAPNRVADDLESRVLALRKHLRTYSDLGEYGATAIRDELLRLRARQVPSVRTIGRILERRGALDGRQRVRRNPPPPGWYLEDLAGARVELDSFDIVEGLVIRGSKGKRPVGVEVFSGSIQWNQPARRADGLLAQGRNYREKYDGFPVGALAELRPAGLRPVRQ